MVLDSPTYSNDNWLKCSASIIRRPIAIPSFLNLKNDKICTIKRAEMVYREKVDTWNNISRELATGYKNIHFIDLEQVLCTKGICSMLDRQGIMLYRDLQHLNVKGSIYVSDFIMTKLRGNVAHSD